MLAFNDVKVYKEKLSALICEMWESRKTRFTKANNLWPCLYFLLLRSDLSLKQYYCHHQEVSLLESQEKEEALKQLSSVSKYGWVHRGGHQWALLLSNSCHRLLCLGMCCMFCIQNDKTAHWCYVDSKVKIKFLNKSHNFWIRKGI